MVKTYSFKEVSDLLAITPQAVYKLFNNHKDKLSAHVSYSKNGGKLLSEHGFDILRGFVKIKTNIQPGLNHETTIQPGCSTVVQPEEKSNEIDGTKPTAGLTTVELLVERLDKELDAKQKVIDSLIKRLDDNGRHADEQRQRSDTIIMKLSNDLSNAVKAIEGSRAEIRMLENRMDAVGQVQLMSRKEVEPEVIQNSWMRKVGDWLFEIIGPGATDRATTSTYYDFKYL